MIGPRPQLTPLLNRHMMHSSTSCYITDPLDHPPLSPLLGKQSIWSFDESDHLKLNNHRPSTRRHYPTVPITTRRRSIPTIPPPPPSSECAKPWATLGNHPRSRFPRHRRKRCKNKQTSKKKVKFEIILRPLPRTISIREIKDVVYKLGHVKTKAVSLPMDQNSSEYQAFMAARRRKGKYEGRVPNRGFCFVEFRTIEDAEKALAHFNKPGSTHFGSRTTMTAKWSNKADEKFFTVVGRSDAKAMSKQSLRGTQNQDLPTPTQSSLNTLCSTVLKMDDWLEWDWEGAPSIRSDARLESEAVE